MITQQPGSMAPELLSQGDNFFTFHLLSADDLKTLQRHNAHFSDDILASIINEPIKGNCFFWSAPDQPFVLPARILDFNKVGSDFPGADQTATPLDVRASQVGGETRKAEDELVQAVIDTITSTQPREGVEFYNLPDGHPEAEAMVACYRPRLSAQVAKRLSDFAKSRFTVQDKPTFIQDHYLDQALRGCGLVEDVQQVRAQRNGKTGDYYLVPKNKVEGDFRDPITIL